MNEYLIGAGAAVVAGLLVWAVVRVCIWVGSVNTRGEIMCERLDAEWEIIKAERKRCAEIVRSFKSVNSETITALTMDRIFEEISNSVEEKA